MTHTYIGVDLSKDWIDIFHPSSGASRLPNTDTDLRTWLAKTADDEMLVFEATSLCDGPIMRAASAQKVPFHRLNPLFGWHFSRSLNLPKTDAVDARMLARMGCERQLQATPYVDAAREDLAALTGRRNQLKRIETQEKNRLRKAGLDLVRRDIEDHLISLASRIRRLDNAIAQHIRSHPELHRASGLLRSIPGIGATTCATLLAHMPELGTLDRRQAASLGGLAPKARESGRWQGQRRIGRGRRHIRGALYMAALNTMRKGGPFEQRVQKLRAKAKPGKVIAIAIARKLLTIANAVLRDCVPFERQRHQK